MRVRHFARALLLSSALIPSALPPSSALAAESASAPTDQAVLQADEVIYDGDTKTVSAQGHVEIADQGRVLNAEKVVYDQATDKVTAIGHVSVMDANGNVAFADHVVLTDHMRDGALAGFGALIGKNGRLVAATAQRIQGHVIVAAHAAYTPCKICNQPGQRTPVWQVKAERVIYDQTAHRVHFNDATLDVLGVPVLYTPFLSEPDPSVRYASGLLPPVFGNSTKIGYFVRAPVYIALSPSNDLTLAPMFATEGGDVLEAEYRARWNNSGLWLQGSGAYSAQGGLGGSPGAQEYAHLFGSGRIALSDNWRTGFDVQTTSNNAYMRFYDISYLDRLVNDLFVENDSGRSRFNISTYYFQGLRATDQQRLIPYQLPSIDFSYIPLSNVAGGQLRFNINSAEIAREQGPDSQRLTGELRWRLPFVFGWGQLWTFTADARGDVFHVRNDDPINYPNVPTGSHVINRGIPYAELDWRWPFLAQGRGGRSYIIEPVAQFIGQPYGGNPSGIPIEDGDTYEIDDNNIFSASQVPGYGLVESGPRANLGVMAEALFPGGEVQALLGQTFRGRPDPVLASFLGQTGSQSDVVGRFTVKFPHLDVTDRIDFDHSSGALNRHEVYVTGSYGRSSLQVSYVQLPPETVALGLPKREEVNMQGDLNFYQNWQAFAAIRRDLLAGEFLDSEYGLGYEDDCLAISLAYRRKYTFDTTLGVPPSTSVILRLNLKTTGAPIQPFSLFPQDVFGTARN